MIEANLSPRVEVTVSSTKSIKYVIEALSDKWKNVHKKNSKLILYLIPIDELWIPQELTIFSAVDCGKAYDIGDIYTAYGSPSTNLLLMKYQWSEGRKDEGDNTVRELEEEEDFKESRDEGDNREVKEDEEGEVEEEEEEGSEKDRKLLDNDLNDFDPLELLGIEDEKKNSTEEEEYLNFDIDEGKEKELREEKRSKENSSGNNNNYNNINEGLSKKGVVQKRIAFVNNVSTESFKMKSNDNSFASINNTNNYNDNYNYNNQNFNCKLRTGYNEVFCQKEIKDYLNKTKRNSNSNINTKNNIPSNFNNISSHIKSDSISSSFSMSSSTFPKKKIPFINNVKDSEVKELKTQQRIIQEKTIKPKPEEQSKIETSRASSPIKRHLNFSNLNYNKNSLMLCQQNSNLGYISLFNNDTINNTKLNDFPQINEMSNFFAQNSNFGSLFEHGNTTNYEFFKNNFSSRNIFKSEYNKEMHNKESEITTLMVNREKDDNENYKNIKSNDDCFIENENEMTNKKRKRKKERKKKHNPVGVYSKEKEYEKMSKTKDNYIINDQSTLNSTHPRQYYPQFPLHLDIPHPSTFIDNKSNFTYGYQTPFSYNKNNISNF